jgi:predicted XRE-type DNA-binding protein
MDLMRIGDKLISRSKIARLIDAILQLRVQGASQQEVANELHVDRAFVSRVETLGEVRKGGRLAIVGFPIGNRDEVLRIAQDEGVEFSLILTDEERWGWTERMSGVEVVNQLFDLISEIKEYDNVIFIGSDKRIRLVETILGRDMVVAIQIGTSPIKGDVTLDPDHLREAIRRLKAKSGSI